MLARTNTIAAAAVMLAASFATPAAAQQDLRNPDNRVATAQQDLRNPDNRVATQQAQGQDLRNPDNRYAGPQVSDVRVPDVAAPRASGSSVSSTGFDWGDAGIGAAGLLGLLALAAGTVLIAGHFRHRGDFAQPSH